MLRPGWSPPESPYKILQEILWPDEWRVLVGCLMLNRTRRAQVDRVIWKFFDMWPNASAAAEADHSQMSQILAPLGFRNKRTETIIKMSRKFLEPTWCHASELPGIGEYGSRAWEIFFLGFLGDDPPNDHALLDYWVWLTSNGENCGQEKIYHIS